MDDRFKTESVIGMGQNMQISGLVGPIVKIELRAYFEIRAFMDGHYLENNWLCQERGLP